MVRQSIISSGVNVSIFDIFDGLKKEREAASAEPITFIAAGLGNPEERYLRTRHNVGFQFMDYFSEKHGFKIDRAKFHSLAGDFTVGGVRVLFMKPETYMNSSGTAIREAADFYKIPPEHVLVIHDDISLPTGKLRIRKKGSDGGHNGLKSIIYQLGSDAFPRIKIGVGGKPSPEWDLADWVLSNFSEGDEKLIFDALSRASEALPLIVSGDADAAQNKYGS